MTTHSDLLDELNAALAAQSLPHRFSAAQLSAALATSSVGRLRNACRRAATDSGALSFIRAALGNSKSTDEEPRLFRHVKVFGRTAAMEFRPTQTRNGIPTIEVDAAHRASPGHVDSENRAARRYAWEERLTVQLTKRELPLLAATLLGYLPAFKAEHHGAQHEKTLDVARADNGVFVARMQARHAGTLRVVAVPAEELFYLTCLVLEQLRLVTGCTAATVELALRGCAQAQLSAAGSGGAQPTTSSS